MQLFRLNPYLSDQILISSLLLLPNPDHFKNDANGHAVLLLQNLLKDIMFSTAFTGNGSNTYPDSTVVLDIKL
jgi:hypothetical protein